MSEYDKELQSNTPQYDEARDPKRRVHNAEEERRREEREREAEREEEKRSAP
jgi:hypothetical protein